MSTFLACVKKPSALPLLRGSEKAFAHLDPVQVLTSNEKLAAAAAKLNPELVCYIPGMTDPTQTGSAEWRDRTSSRFAFFRIPDDTAAEAVRDMLRPGEVLNAKGIPTLARACKLDLGAFTKEETASLGDREQESVITRELAISTACVAKASAVK